MTIRFTQMISTGVITDYVDLAQNCLQGQTLEFELNGYDTRSELLQALQDGKIRQAIYEQLSNK